MLTEHIAGILGHLTVLAVGLVGIQVLFAVPLISWETLGGQPPTSVAVSVASAAALALALARYRLPLQSALRLLATRSDWTDRTDNGGGNVYRASNPLGTGGYTPIWIAVWSRIPLALLSRAYAVLHRPVALAAASGFLYFFAIHSAFESQARYHMPAVELLALLVGVLTASLAEPSPPSAASTTGGASG